MLQEIRDDIGDSNIWLSVDETTDSCGRFIANVIVGKLTENEPGTPHLIISRVLEVTNHSTIARVVRDALRVLWPVQENEEKLLLIVTDAAAYMIKAATALQVFYPKAVHVTCLAHSLHRLAEEIRANFPEVNALISSVKKVFVKAPLRVKLFSEMLPDTRLPPQPILTRWGTWIEAALYYSEHLEDVKKVLEALDKNDAASIETAVNACNEKNLQAKLVFIRTYFSKLPAAITRLEEKGMPLTSALQVFETAITEEVPGEIGKSLRHKIERIEARNPGLTFLRDVNRVLLGESEKQFSSYSASDIASLRYCPVTSCDVERSFSSYKNILSDRRKNFLPENLEKYLVVYCNKNNN